MPHGKRKIRKQRGSRTYGWGQTGQHRGAGRRGGRGATGYGKHKWTITVKYKPNYFGKHGFHAVAESAVKAINVGELHDVSERLLSERTAKQEEKDVTLDLESLGYDKLLGKGKISRPLIVKVKEYSKKAAEKVEAAGGRIAKLE